MFDEIHDIRFAFVDFINAVGVDGVPFKKDLRISSRHQGKTQLTQLRRDRENRGFIFSANADKVNKMEGLSL